MTFTPYDLWLAEALAEERLAAARRARLDPGSRPSAHGVPVRKTRRHGSAVLPWPTHLQRPVHGTAGH